MEIDLVYITDRSQGIHRRKQGKGFAYYNAKGELIRNQEKLHRIRQLKIPPIWKDVWICDQPRGHLQAVGQDLKGRKQYLYHHEWNHYRNQSKFHKISEFARCLPEIREKAFEDVNQPGWPREKVLGLLVITMDELHIRVGNEQYKKRNQTFGLTTLRRRHLHFEKDRIKLEYKAKSGKYRKINIKNNQLVNLIRQLSELPGYEIFRYRDKGKTIPVDSQDVNEYLKTISHEKFTSKDFRTWGGTVTAIEVLPEALKEVKENKRKKLTTTLIRTVASRLGNTVSICRDYYIHPAVLQKVEEHKIRKLTPEPFEPDQFGLTPAEETALVLIEKYEKNKEIEF